MVYCYSCGSDDVDCVERRRSERRDNVMCDDCFQKILIRHAENKIVEVNKAKDFVFQSNKLERLELDIKAKLITMNELIVSNNKLETHLQSILGCDAPYYAKSLKERNVHRSKSDRHVGLDRSELMERHLGIMEIVHCLDKNFKTKCMVPANHHAEVVELRTARNDLSGRIMMEQSKTTMLKQQIEKCELRDKEFMTGTGSLFLEAKEHFDELQSSV